MERSKKDYIYECENGIVYGVKGKCCCICKHCTDLFYDYANGPYMFWCELDEDTSECLNCNKFELQEGTLTVEEYEEKINSPEYKEKQKAIQDSVDKLLNDKEFMEKYQKAVLAAPIISAMLRTPRLNFLKNLLKGDK